ncbi:MAG: hypothetical protein L0229_05425 [Blastocatellia bacterium]|nr:hypothetical protein [Blastocatellia bacterium]
MNTGDTQVQRDRIFYNLAERYLIKLVKTYLLESSDTSNEDALAALSKYFQPPAKRPGSITGRNGIYRQLVHSAQDYGAGTGVIGKPLGGVDALEEVLFDFDPGKVIEKYRDTDHWEDLLDEIVKKVNPKGKIRRESNSLWPRFSKSVISGAAFLKQFETAADFYGWADEFDRDEKTRLVLPEVLKREIYGFGFAIACVFLMDLGYVNFVKPDVHVKEILTALDLSSSKSDYEVFKAAVRIAGNVETTPYKVDRMCWLIGSGNFYLDKGGIMIGGRRNDFIAYARNGLKNARGETETIR